MHAYIPLCETLPDDVLLKRIVPMLGVIPLFYLQLTSHAAAECNIWDHLASLRLDPITGPRALAAIRKQGASRIRRLIVNMRDFQGEEDMWPVGLLDKVEHIQILRPGPLWDPSGPVPQPVTVFLKALKQTLQFDRLTHCCFTVDTVISNIVPVIATKPRPNLRVLHIEKATLSHESIDYVLSQLTLPNIEILHLNLEDDRPLGFSQIGSRWWPVKWLNLRPLLARCNNPKLHSISILSRRQYPLVDWVGPFDKLDVDFEAVFGISLDKFDSWDHSTLSIMYREHTSPFKAHLTWARQPAVAADAIDSLHSYIGRNSMFYDEIDQLVHPRTGLTWEGLPAIIDKVCELERTVEDAPLLAKVSAFLAEHDLRFGSFPDDPACVYIRGVDGTIHWDLDQLWNIAVEYFHKTGTTILLNIAAHSRSFITRFILNAELRDEAMRLFEPGMRLQDIRGLYYQNGYMEPEDPKQLEKVGPLTMPLLPAQFRTMNPWDYFTSLGLDYSPLPGV